jgi:hypothetical protein
VQASGQAAQLATVCGAGQAGGDCGSCAGRDRGTVAFCPTGTPGTGAWVSPRQAATEPVFTGSRRRSWHNLEESGTRRRRQSAGRERAAGACRAGVSLALAKGGDDGLTSVSAGVRWPARGRSQRGPARPSAQGRDSPRPVLSRQVMFLFVWTREITRRRRTAGPPHGAWEPRAPTPAPRAGRPLPARGVGVAFPGATVGGARGLQTLLRGRGTVSSARRSSWCGG